ncbi:lytic murein transglycosylase B [Rickettsiella grylli]|uniref:Lytic murein transglycosylase B n=1 Tax=Rickettsiella grylli TaxID=59196 RepID=A8PLN9_9COXI|nr:lytic murein transglycosylase B [Rickettsiella grylli]EDP45751.1 lytic murein transglycosylase B [Rickettsiella grylli]
MRKNKSSPINLNTLLLLLTLSLASCTAYANKPEVQSFIDTMVKKYNFDRQQLQQLFNTIKPHRSIITSFITPKERLTWSEYQSIFVTTKRAQMGVNFWNAHAKILAEAEKRYGVPASIIVAILGVETRYGEVTGKYRVIDSLSTLSFNTTRRSHFFKQELTQFLLLSRENPVINPQLTKGSYAGAIGKVQFMPSNYRHLSVDATHKGYSDLIHNTDDAILSIANYLKFFGWIRKNPIAVPARFSRRTPFHLPPLNNNMTVKDFSKYHIYPKKAVNSHLKAFLIVLPLKKGNEYWLGFNNFQTIKHYNASSLYAMAVFQLSHLIHHLRQHEYRSYAHKK